MEFSINKQPKVIKHILKDDGQFPNSGLFLLIYKNAFILPAGNAESMIKETFVSNNWKNTWSNGILDYHHYHSITHEVLGVYEGEANVQFGGPNGLEEMVSKGDVVIIPAGVAHKCNWSSDDFKCIGAYPEGMTYDLKNGEPSERPQGDENIASVKLPDTDPVLGYEGPLILNWEMQ